MSLTVAPNYVLDSFFKNMSLKYSFPWMELSQNSHFWLKLDFLILLLYFIMLYFVTFFAISYFVIFCLSTSFQSTAIIRSNLLEVLCEKCFFFFNSAKFTNIHLWWSPFFDEIADLQGLSFSKERLQNKCFLKKLQHFSEHLFDRPHRKTATNHWCCLLFHYNISFGSHVRLVENDFKHIFQPAIKLEINKNKNFVLLRELLIKIA